MIKFANALLLPAIGCFVSLSPAPHGAPPCQRIDVTDAAHPNRYHAILLFDSQGRVVSCNEGFESQSMQVSYDAQGHIQNVPGMVQAEYDSATGEIDKLVVGSGEEVMDFTFVYNRVELANLKITGGGLLRTTHFVYAYGNSNLRSADPVSVQWHYDEYKEGKHTETQDAQYLMTYTNDPFFVGSNNVISRMVYAYPPRTPMVSVHYHLISRIQANIVTHNLVDGKDVTVNMDNQYSYKMDGQGRPISITTNTSINGKQVPPLTYNIQYTCN